MFVFKVCVSSEEFSGISGLLGSVILTSDPVEGQAFRFCIRESWSAGSFFLGQLPSHRLFLLEHSCWLGQAILVPFHYSLPQLSQRLEFMFLLSSLFAWEGRVATDRGGEIHVTHSLVKSFKNPQSCFFFFLENFTEKFSTPPPPVVSR